MYKSSFFRDFIDLNVAMWSSNNALTPDPEKQPGQLESKPFHWPLMLRGLRMCGWSDTDIKYYLIGNPLIWWGTTVSLIVLTFLLLFLYVRMKRGYDEFEESSLFDSL